jgi:hypothetical protein
MVGLLSRTLVLTSVGTVALLLPANLRACEFCGLSGQTLTSQVAQAGTVLYGTLSDADQDKGETVMNVEKVVKKHKDLGDETKVTLARFIPIEKDPKYKVLIFCDIYKGKVDPYHLLSVKTESDVATYLKGALEVKDKDTAARLAFFFPYLDDADLEISNDANKEFGNADYKDVREAAKSMPPGKIAGWLKPEANTPAYRYGLYALLLGHCGKPEHAKVLRAMLDDPKKRLSSGVDGVMVGYTLLDPKEGWAYVREILKDSTKEFALRYAGLRAARWFHNVRTDVLDKKDIVTGVAELLDQDDIADLAIEDLRRWGEWDFTERILALETKKSHDIPIIHRNILRYALQSPDKKAAEFVDDLRKKNPRLVADAEELLKLDQSQPSPVKK